ncbi:tRNA 2-selenouridine(34) synthase MnmH [Clostridium sp. 'deep sea']|uniref:tRNA 2-selenouridine(34) synthase MnmH n=1 Tax=Clostridium sp. 'deep sea' TaxID=2779445 RepID=UPI0018965FFA|nr:tRNA 2-selenouridine(34) synthase MnmH [Clostridium sp. 'deep sea']QOR36455.1 tRNA 2-selenouridine(34) synthase MnmH [Clostridium sp. 'deep sea']
MYKSMHITIEEVLKIDNKLFIDVRSPSEYAQFHIPNSVNIPILNDQERHEIGLVHKNKGPVIARRAGLAYVTPKLMNIVNQLIELSERHTLILYCARGGMRSQSLSSVLQLVKVPHKLLMGGYKAYRKKVSDYLTLFPTNEIVVLHGLTGVGKTLILNELKKNAPVIDIEALANHRGSAFGSVGLGNQPTQKMFDSRLFDELLRLQNEPYIIVECESRRTGKINLPNKFFTKMKEGTHIHAYTTVEKRIERIIDEYGPSIIKVDELAKSISKLNRNLGNEKVNYLLNCLNNNQIAELVRILLVDYYDPLYGYSNSSDNRYKFNVSADNIIKAAASIKLWCEEQFKVESI